MKKFVLLFLLIPNIAFALLPNYCRRFQLPGWWGSGEYNLMWRKKRFYPALATTSPIGTAQGDAGVLGLATTTILFGDEYVRDSPKSGGRADFGFWMLPCLGFGATYFAFGNEKVNFNADSDVDGAPIIARPFFNVATAMQDASLIAFPAVFGSGSLDIDTSNHLWGADVYTRYRFLDICCFKLDLLGGFRYTRMDDDLDINTFSTTILTGVVNNVSDRFNARNDFYSGLVGFIGELRSQCWAIHVIGKVGIGNMVQQIFIHGETISNNGGVITFSEEGLLARSSNSGNHSRNHFEVVPEINAQIQLRVWSHFWLTAGYQYIFWPKVLLAGEQVDLNLDLTGGTPNPAFVPHDKSFWAQGLTAGIYILY